MNTLSHGRDINIHVIKGLDTSISLRSILPDETHAVSSRHAPRERAHTVSYNPKP